MATALMVIACKVIIFDTAAVVLAMSIGYWLVVRPAEYDETLPSPKETSISSQTSAYDCAIQRYSARPEERNQQQLARQIYHISPGNPQREQHPKNETKAKVGTSEFCH